MNGVVVLADSEQFHIMQPETLPEHIKFDHGYTSKSPAIVNVSFPASLYFICMFHKFIWMFLLCCFAVS